MTTQYRDILDRFVVPLLFVVIATFAALSPYVIETNIEDIQSQQIEEESYLTSPYDNIFQHIGKLYNIDWLLLSAIAHAESEYRCDAISRAGAVGLMQIMPSVAQNMGYERDSLFNAEVSVEVAAKLLNDNRKMLRLPASCEDAEQIKFVLACYNAGYSRIADARRLARFYQENAEDWDCVASHLKLLAEPEYAEHEVVKSGLFKGSSETISYVKKVMRIYKRYCNRID